uniref:Uncharacterized protein n=1 Tax=Pyramimonas obovata TaxID=1411642 RepID=A0A7S0MXD8_9CHLO|eukprot:CAMPEP_0118933652 /NCGR_PEP_ID=MMETSP1169-20130426/12109_1 /TAXON_ID=36882 /ORGANISM="Pyramimonas obovata, Strain CCMP722" /LENGTH=286 /DNA_ID=CAMNT_0006876443 /DNA_START=34 /DNA_END=894 /DNA_ORIENTATION=+
MAHIMAASSGVLAAPSPLSIGGKLGRGVFVRGSVRGPAQRLPRTSRSSIVVVDARAVWRGSSVSWVGRRSNSRSEFRLFASNEGKRDLDRLEELKETPGMILKVSKGTSYMALLAARKAAREEAAGDEKQLEKVEWAFRQFVESSANGFKEAIKADPNSALAVYNYANFLQTIEDFDEAEKMYRRVLELDGTNTDAANNLGLMLFEQKGNLDGAEEMYAVACQENPNDIDVLYNWAVLRKEGYNDVEGMETLIAQILKVDPKMEEHQLVQDLRGVEVPKIGFPKSQ